MVEFNFPKGQIDITFDGDSWGTFYFDNNDLRGISVSEMMNNATWVLAGFDFGKFNTIISGSAKFVDCIMNDMDDCDEIEDFCKAVNTGNVNICACVGSPFYKSKNEDDEVLI